MKYYIKQAVFSVVDEFSIYDSSGNVVFKAVSEFFTIGKKLRLYHPDGQQAAYIERELFTLMPWYTISAEGSAEQTVRKAFSLFPEYTVEPAGWTVSGDLFAHEYTITHNGETVAGISKEWLSWADTYEIDVCGTAEDALVISVVLVIDAVLAQ